MIDFRTYTEKRKEWWVEERATVPCILPKDGLLAVFLAKDVESVFDANYPQGKNGSTKVWYFNETKDREIAELIDDRIYSNPQALIQHFMVQP